MSLDFDYLDRVRRMATLYTKRKTSDLLEGDYASRLHGKSLDFDDLREYQFGDDVNDIDWKSSSKTGKTLIRRYFADRKHNVCFIGDTGSKMLGDTKAGESKENIALMTFGTAAYVFGKQGVNFSLAFSTSNGISMSQFTTGAAHMEELIYHYKQAMEEGEPKNSLPDVINQVVTSFQKHMVIIIITDSEGLATIEGRLIRRMITNNDVYIFNIEDAFLTTADAFDLDADHFEDSYLTNSESLHQAEVQLRAAMERKARINLEPNRIIFENVNREEEIIDRLIDLFRRRREMQL